MQLNLASEIALVTGASRGIGKSIAIALAQAGAKVIGTATSVEGAEKINLYLETHHLVGEGKVLDLANPTSIEALVASLNQTMPTILVNNAAVTRDNLLLRMSPEEWETVINTNLTGVYRLTKACLRAMTKARRGRIITITSVVALTGNAGQANYAAAKAGVIAFSKSLAREIGSRGITVNTVSPGFIETDMTKDLPESHRTQLLQQIPLNRAGTPDDVAAAVVFLASPAAAYITGETLQVNGGMYMP